MKNLVMFNNVCTVTETCKDKTTSYGYCILWHKVQRKNSTELIFQMNKTYIVRGYA